MSATPLRHRTESVTAIPSYPRNMPNHSIHSPSSITNSSPSHAELLAHSLAAAASNNNNDHEEDFRGFSPEVPQFLMNKDRTLLGSPPQSPFPTSAFSDYGSSQCSSTAYTPAESEVDPFEYDNHSHHSDLHTPEPPPPDNFNLFAAAIAMHSLNHNFVLPDFPPQRLVERRPDRFGSGGSDGNGGIATQPQSAPGAPPQDPFAASFAQAISPPSPPAAEVPNTTLDPMENTLAARRRSPCSSRRQSCMGLEQQRTYPVLRRINTDGANSGRISPYSSCPDTAATIRPRTSSASALLPPPTPPSPEDPVPSQKQQYMQTEHEEMSPPATPQTRADCFSSSIPRHFEDYGGFYGGGPSSGGSIESDAFEFDYCIVAGAPPMTAALPSSATISGTGFF